MKTPLGKNDIGKFLSKAAQKAGIRVPGFNKQATTLWRRAVFQGLLMQTHQRTLLLNIESLQSYKSANEQ